ncbi:hypothetical protein AA313_de0204495 [Arthrobotrys entomopaga]|nr:hypothetical protein AA313_de0204495 [Arthrobotrys entomopaga]
MFPETVFTRASSKVPKWVRNISMLGRTCFVENEKYQAEEDVKDYDDYGGYPAWTGHHRFEAETKFAEATLLEFIKRIPNGGLRTFDYKVEPFMNRQILFEVLSSQHNIVSLNIWFPAKTFGDRVIPENDLPRMDFPKLNRLSLGGIIGYNEVNVAKKILDASPNTSEIELIFAIGYADPKLDCAMQMMIISLHAKHNLKIFKLANVTLSQGILELSKKLEELHLRDIKVPGNISLRDMELSPKKLLIKSRSTDTKFYRDEFMAKLVPGLEELLIITENVNRELNGESEPRETRPIPLEFILRHQKTLRCLSLFQRNYSCPPMDIESIGYGDELQLFNSLELQEYTTAIKFKSVEDPLNDRRYLTMNDGLDYGHYALLEKLYVVPDFRNHLPSEIVREQKINRDLDPMRSTTYQMAHLLLANIAYHATELPQIRYIIVGTGTAYTGQKVFQVSWLKHTPPRKRGNGNLGDKYLFALSPSYNLHDFKERGIEFRCFEGTKFTSAVNKRYRSFW